MKAKYIILNLLVFLLLAACQTDEKENSRSRATGELTIFPVVNDEITRSTDFEFFGPGSGAEIDLIVSDSRGDTHEHVYWFDDEEHVHIFRSDAPYYFPLDDTYIKELTAVWPREEVREFGVPYDQRNSSDFRNADWLISELPFSIMPTESQVMLHFERENSKLHFQLTGQNALGLDITELTIELCDNNRQPLDTAFKAYCDPTTGIAQIVISPGTRLYAVPGGMIGALKVNNLYYYTMIFPDGVDLETEPKTRYMVTLTPNGYNMTMEVTIEEFQSNTNPGIGIPFQKPSSVDGSYMINNAVQLVTLGYLVRHYSEDTGGVDWRTQTYFVSEDVAGTITDDLAAAYIPISVDRDGFTGNIYWEDTTNTVDNIPYGDGNVLEIFEL